MTDEDTSGGVREPQQDGGQRERMCLFADGFSLYNGIHDTCGRKYPWLAPVSLGEELRPRNGNACAKHVTADVIGEPHAARRQAAQLNALTVRERTKLRVVKGRYRLSDRSCRSCGATWTRREEKETESTSRFTSCVTLPWEPMIPRSS
ncbi:hypothetical protein GCM10009767_35360 [Kocuria aegyptia]|uniref:Uncharacterized protein n=1 Tax=Kocuria aegyptia TaxID=330943 RepID=A0ABN2L3X8_9MICC